MRIFVKARGWNGIKSEHTLFFDGKSIVRSFDEPYTHIEAVFRAIIHALDLCSGGGEVILSDRVVLEQIRGTWPIRNSSLLPLLRQIEEKLGKSRTILRWLPKEKMKKEVLAYGKKESRE